MKNALRFAAVSLLTLAGLIAGRPAGAEEEFNVAVSGGRVVVTTKGKWHINKDYPWRLTIGGSKIEKDKFALSDASASVEAPKGEGKLKGGVCNGDQCLRLEKTVTIQ
jgi:hypothetical protein